MTTRSCSIVLAALTATAVFAPPASAADHRVGGWYGGGPRGYYARPYAGPARPWAWARPWARPFARPWYRPAGYHPYTNGYGYRPVYGSPGLLAYPTPVYGGGCGSYYGGCGGWGYNGWGRPGWSYAGYGYGGYGYGVSTILSPVVAAPAITYSSCGFGFGGYYRGCW